MIWGTTTDHAHLERVEHEREWFALMGTETWRALRSSTASIWLRLWQPKK